MAIMIIDDSVFNEQSRVAQKEFGRIVGQIFRLLPLREEDKDYLKPLDTLIVEVAGYSWIVPDSKAGALLSKLRGLKSDDCKEDFMLFRRMIFEACGLATDIKNTLGRGDAA